MKPFTNTVVNLNRIVIFEANIETAIRGFVRTSVSILIGILTLFYNIFR